MDPYLPSEASPVYVDSAGRIVPGQPWDPARPTALLPGAFNPIHAGHRGLAAVATELLGLPVAYELSIANVDKPPLSADEVRRRLAQFAGHGAVWLTQAPRFIQKAALFPGAVFVIGADTAWRIVDPRYYDDELDMHATLTRLHEYGCRFLVACRLDAPGRCVELTEVPVPRKFHALFEAIPPARFRLDLSSTEIRQRHSGIK
jgi:nicotinic acid mononucleotide adenylyltransferase